ncbi:MAG: IS4 family transposase [Chloroflexi bacterium]|nr:MAG: IS4 family transposase [Chloroflexota bacterium]
MANRVVMKQKMKDNPFITYLVDERKILLMTHDTPSQDASAAGTPMGAQLEHWLLTIPAASASAPHKRGRPRTLSAWHMSLAVLLCLLHGLQSQLEVWRQIAFYGVGYLPALPLSDQAVYDRLEQDGVSAFQSVFAHVSQWLAQRLAPYENRTLAPFATAVVALDESVLDRVKRWVSWLREVPDGDSRLLPGRLVGLFDVRLQQWRRLDVLLDANADCKVHARAMLSALAKGTLLLFDLGYFSFPWLDELTQLGYWYITRQRAKTRYQIVHLLYQADGVFDALVYLGVHSSDRAGQLVRLVSFRLGSQQYCYLTNVLDPATLPIVDIARLYGRRWDIELAFRELKEHLGLRLVWSAKLGVIYQQIWACLILAQLLHAYQVELAARAEVEPCEVSLALLSRHLPRLLQHTADPMGFLLEHGRAMRLIRPASRRLREAPVVPLQQVSSPPPELLQPRPAHSAHRKCGSRYTAQS